MKIVREARKQVSRLRSRFDPWVRPETGPGRQGPVRLFAVVGTWMESDVIGATVRHLLDQGCEQVYIVDNDSPDATVEAARSAGAHIAVQYSSDAYDETLRLSLMSSVAEHVSRLTGEGSVWWMYADADEFTFAPQHERVIDWLPKVPAACRVVGAYVMNHYPSPGVETPVGECPLDVQPMAEDFAQPMCGANHRKHPLVRWDRQGPNLRVGHGFHKVYGERLREPQWELVMHHFPFRNEEFTRSRLRALLGSNGGGGGRADLSGESARHMKDRSDGLDAVYDGRWSDVPNFLRGGNGVVLAPWVDLLAGRTDRTRV